MWLADLSIENACPPDSLVNQGYPEVQRGAQTIQTFLVIVMSRHNCLWL